MKDLEVTAPDQVWMSDLTYLRTEEGFLYAALHDRDIVRLGDGAAKAIFGEKVLTNEDIS